MIQGFMIWAILAGMAGLILMIAILFRLIEIRDACEYLAEKVFRQDVEIDDLGLKEERHV